MQNETRRLTSLRLAGLLLLLPSSKLAAAESPVAVVSRMQELRDVTVTEGSPQVVPEGPNGAKVTRCDGEFSLRLDLKNRQIDPRKYDLLKLTVRTDAHATLVVSLENFPHPGDLSHWYVLDGARKEIPWRTIWIDLNKPEEVKLAGKYKGLDAPDESLQGLRLRGEIQDLRQAGQPPGRSVWLSEVRFVRRVVGVDWDQSQAPCTWGDGQDLVFRYPLTISNHSERDVTAALRIIATNAGNALAALSKDRITLRAGRTAAVEATISLPAGVAAKQGPLYCERFEVFASAEGVPDSETTILRSSDVIALSVTVPFPEELLSYPLLSRVRDMPESVTKFNVRNRAHAAQRAAEATPEDLLRALDGPLEAFDDIRGVEFGMKSNKDWYAAGERFREGLTAHAFLFDFTGEEQHLREGTRLLLQAAQVFPDRVREWQDIPFSPISHGIISRNTLRLGWATGSMRWPYCYQLHGMFNDFDLLAARMNPEDRRRIIDGFLVPAAIHMRNHYFGLSNQQDVVNYAALYAGLAARNWPLVSHAYDSSHGLLHQIRDAFDDEGMAAEGNYHKPSIEPILYACELLRPRGIDLYDQRLYTILHSRAAAAIRKSYNSPMLGYADQARFAGKPLNLPGEPEGQHLATGLTLLRRNGREVAMNWGVQQNRSALDRCSLRIDRLGGGNYTHSSLGQSVIIIDEGAQDPVPASVLGYRVTGPAQYVCATSDRHFPGATITRTFALLGTGVLVLDRVVCDRPRTVDWCLKDAGMQTSLALRERPGGFTDKPDDTAQNVIFGRNLKFNRHYAAATDDPWTEGQGRLLMAGEPGTQVFHFHVPAAFSAGKKAIQAGVPVLMVRRENVQQTDFVAWFSGDAEAVERVAVLTSEGAPADALGARVTLRGGKTIHAVVNFQPGTEVRLGELMTREVFATDYEE